MSRPLQMLILGGTRFLGRHLAALALEAGHQLTLLHRGRSVPGLFPEATHLIADRDGDLAVLDDGDWDGGCVFKRHLSFPVAPRTRRPTRLSRSLKVAEIR